MEQNVVDAIKSYVQANGGKAIKIQGLATQEAGTPDLVGGLWGVPFMCEVKQPGDPHPTSPLQQVRIKEWRAQGYCAFVAHSVGEFEFFIREWRCDSEN